MASEPNYSYDTGEGPHIYTVAELTREIKGMLENSFAEVVVEGEISNYHFHRSSGHRYFKLKDDKAVLSCAFWRGSAANLKFEPEDGMKVQALGKISVYEPRGEYQLSVRRLTPLGAGELEIAFRQLFEKLAAEGLFDEDRKQELPAYPFTVGIVTSPTGAAIRDMINIFARRNPLIKLIIYPTAVQGESAAETIAEGIDYLNTRSDIDLIITGRGGGSLEDLWCFNTEVVVRALARSEIPVISGVGHEIDTTLADYVADLRAPTPSAAAEIAAWELGAVVDELNSLTGGMAAALKEMVEDRADELQQIFRRGVFADPLQIVNSRAQTLDQLNLRFALAVKNAFREKQNRLALVGQRLDSLSPLKTLARGYSVARLADSKQVIRSAGQVKKGDSVEVIVEKGTLTATVEKTSAKQIGS